MAYKGFITKLYTILYIMVMWFIGEYKTINGANGTLGLWVARLNGKGVQVYIGPLPEPYLGVSWPPIPLIILDEDRGVSVDVLLHEYGHIQAGPFSSEEEAEFIKEKCLWRDELI